MPKFRVPVTYQFEGYFEIEADSMGQAAEYTDKYCGCVSPNIQSSLPDEDVDWEFPVHPETTIGNPKPIV